MTPQQALRRKRLAVTGVLLFFFGFPLAGMLYVYFQAHGAIQSSARRFAETDVVKLVQGRDFDSLEFLATLELKGRLDRKDFESKLGKLGAYRGNDGFKVRRSSVGERKDEVWQFVDLECLMRFEHGTASLDLTAARRSLSMGEWRIERFDLLPLNVE